MLIILFKKHLESFYFVISFYTKQSEKLFKKNLQFVTHIFNTKSE